jgi:hypothetical protein
VRIRNLTTAARKAGKSAAQLLVANPDQIVRVSSFTNQHTNSLVQGILPGKGQLVPPKKPAVRTNEKAEGTSDTTLKGLPTIVPRPRARPTKQAKPVHTPKQPRWTRISVPVDMLQDDLQTRMFIREFMMRFSPIMDKDARRHLDELEEIVGDSTLEWTDDTLGKDAEGDNDSSEAMPMVSWVSEGCAKSIFIGLLGLLANSNNPCLTKA